MGKVRIGFSIASIASAGLAGSFIDVVPAGWVFAAAAIISMPGAIAVFFMRTDAPKTADVRRPFWEIARGYLARRALPEAACRHSSSSGSAISGTRR